MLTTTTPKQAILGKFQKYRYIFGNTGKILGFTGILPVPKKNKKTQD